MWRDAALVAGRDLRIEVRSRVTLHQVAPFALLVLVLFAFALDPDRGVLERATPGLYWVTVLFSALLALARSAKLEEADGVRDALRLVRPRPGRRLPRQDGGGGGRAAGARGPARRRASSILYGADPAGVGLLARHVPGRDRCGGRHRYAVRRPGQRPAGARDAAPPAAPARAGARPHRRHAGVRGGARRRPRRRLAVVRPARRLRCSLFGRRGLWPTARSWRARDRRPRPPTPPAAPSTGRPAARPGPAGTGSRGTRVLGVLALAGVALLVLYGLVVSPADVEMGDSVRLMYVHVPVGDLPVRRRASSRPSRRRLWLWKRTAGWDALAEAGAEVGLVFARHHPGHRVALGPADLGHLLDLGRPAHLDGRADRAARRLPGRCAASTSTPTPGRRGRPSSACCSCPT